MDTLRAQTAGLVRSPRRQNIGVSEIKEEEKVFERSHMVQSLKARALEYDSLRVNLCSTTAPLRGLGQVA